MINSCNGCRFKDNILSVYPGVYKCPRSQEVFDDRDGYGCEYYESSYSDSCDNDGTGCLGYLIGFAVFYQAVHYIEDKFGAYGTLGILLALAIVFRKQVKFLLKWCFVIGTSLLVAGPIAMSLILVIPKRVFGIRDAEIGIVLLAWMGLAFVTYKLLIKDLFKKICKRWG